MMAVTGGEGAARDGGGGVLVTGAGGQLGIELVEALRRGGTAVAPCDRATLDVTDRAAVFAAVEASAPAVVVNAAAWTDVDGCEADPDRAMAVNAHAVAHLADAARRAGARFCQISTDFVFDGARRRPYDESDQPAPLSVYGRSKLAGEQAAGADALVVRTSSLYGDHGHHLVRTVLDRADASSDELTLVSDRWISPTVVADLVPVLLRLLDGRRTGLFHLAGAGAATPFEVAQAALAAAGHDPRRARPVPSAELRPARPAPRPVYSVLGHAALTSAGLPTLPPYGPSLAALVERLRSRRRPDQA